MTAYINQSEVEKVTAINYDWNNVNQVVIGNGIPNGTGKKIQVFGFLNNKPNMDFRLDVELNKNNIPDMSTLQYSQQINYEGGSISDLNNIYANFAQSSYTCRNDNFPYEELNPSKKLYNNESVQFRVTGAKDDMEMI